MLEHPTTGLHAGITRDAYEAIDALNQSTIKIAYERSLHHAQYELVHPSAPTEAKMHGVALHTLILEPAEFDKRFGPMPVTASGDRASRRTGAGARAWETYDLLYPNRFPIKQADIEELRVIADRVRSHPVAAELIGRAVHRESVAIWNHPIHGFSCKGQVDLLTSWNGWSVICDLKSCIDVSPMGFEKAVMNYGYMIQAHWYTEGLSEIARADRRFMFIAFEKDPPYAVCVHELSAALMLEGRHRCDVVSARWAKALQSGKWSSYPVEPQVVEGKPWAMTHLREFDVE